jgi:phosphoribosylamine--glycine ligase
MVVVGPEVPLVEGIHDFFLSDPLLKHVSVIGPKQEAAMPGSKDSPRNSSSGIKYPPPVPDF